MKRRPLDLIDAVLLLFSVACGGREPGPLAPGEPMADSVPRIDGLLEPIRAVHDLPAVGAAVFDSSGRLLGIGAVGQRAVGVDGAPTEAVTVEDRRHLGSDTKAMTATLAAMVVEQSALEFDTPVTQILPEADPAWASVTVRHLLSHTSGLHDDTGLARFVTNASRAGDDAADDALVAMASAGLD